MRAARPHRDATLLVVALGCVWLSACSAKQARGPQPLATSLQELVPHADRDHFVYVFLRTADGVNVGDGIQVEHVAALERSGDFEVTLSENGMGTGRVRVRDTGAALLLLDEDDLTRGVRLIYDPPLPYIEVPLLAGERQTSTTATVARLSDGKGLGNFQVTQTVEASAAPAIHSPLGHFARGVSLRTLRTLRSPEDTIELSTTMLVAAGIGEIQSDGTTPGAPIVHRELACATIGGRRLGDCHNLKARWEAMKRARSTNVR